MSFSDTDVVIFLQILIKPPFYLFIFWELKVKDFWNNGWIILLLDVFHVFLFLPPQLFDLGGEVSKLMFSTASLDCSLQQQPWQNPLCVPSGHIYNPRTL